MGKTLTATLPNGKTLTAQITDNATLDDVNNAFKGAGVDPSGFQDQIRGALGVTPNAQDNGDLVPPAAPSREIQLPAQIQQLHEYAQRLPFGSKEQDKAYKIFESERDNFLKTNPKMSAGDAKQGTQNKDLEDTLKILDQMQGELNQAPNGPVLGRFADWTKNAPEFLTGGHSKDWRGPLNNYETDASILAGKLAKDTLGRVNQTEFNTYLKSVFPTPEMYSDVQKGKIGRIKNLLMTKLGSASPNNAGPSNEDLMNMLLNDQNQ